MKLKLTLKQFREKFKTELVEDYAGYLGSMLEDSDLTTIENWEEWTEEEFKNKNRWELEE